MFIPRALDNGPQRNLDNTLGAAFLGLVFACIIFGISSLQMYLYYHRFPKDTLLHKISVGVLWTLDAFHLALVTHAVYFYMVSGFGNEAILKSIIWSIKLQVLINVVIVLLVQSLYSYRVWLLSGYHGGVLGYIVAGVVAGGFVIGVVFSYLIFTTDTFVTLSVISWAVNASLAASTTIDFIISAAMCYYLRRSKGVENRLNSRISLVMQYSLSSGLLTSAASLSTLFTFSLMPNTLVYLGLEFILTKLYVVSFLAMLNARQRSDGHSLSISSGSSRLSANVPGFRTPTSSTYTTRSPSDDRPNAHKWSLETPKPSVKGVLVTHSQHTSPIEKPEYAARW